MGFGESADRQRRRYSAIKIIISGGNARWRRGFDRSRPKLRSINGKMRMRKEQHHNQQGSRMKMKSQDKKVAATPNQEYHAQIKSFHQQWTLVKAVEDNPTRV